MTTQVNEKRLHVTVGGWFTEWLEVYAKPKVKQSTFVNYRTHINKRVIPCIGHVKLSNLRVDILQRFFNEQNENGSLREDGGPLSPKTIKNIYVMMHTAFKQAYENGLIPKNYIDLVKLPKISKKEMRVLSLDEHKRLYEEIKTSDERYKIGVLICLATGIRVGELVGLQWKDIDKYKQIIKIRRTLNRLPAMNTSEHKTEIIIDTPKNEKSIRDIPLPDFLIPFLNDYQLKQEKEKIIADDIYNDRDFIICNELGNPKDNARHI